MNDDFCIISFITEEKLLNEENTEDYDKIYSLVKKNISFEKELFFLPSEYIYNIYKSYSESKAFKLEQREKGDKGNKGDVGDTGEKGEKGDKGDIGDKGDKGDSGDVGQKGDKGDVGQKGDKGDKGDTGQQGPATVNNYVHYYGLQPTNSDINYSAGDKLPFPQVVVSNNTIEPNSTYTEFILKVAGTYKVWFQVLCSDSSRYLNIVVDSNEIPYTITNSNSTYIEGEFLIVVNANDTMSINVPSWITGQNNLTIRKTVPNIPALPYTLIIQKL